jgi:hypothetical protein
MAPSDIVTFNMRGQEINRVVSNTEFKTYIQKNDGTKFEAAMPKIIPYKGKTVTSGAEYQQHDYQIAASTSIFNINKNEGNLQLWSDGDPSKPIPSSLAKTQIPDLDPTFVKAIGMEESSLGNSKSQNEKMDILQINNGLSNWSDFDAHMEHYGFAKGTLPNPQQSFQGGVMEIATKGYHNQSTKQFEKSGFQGWLKASVNHNGGGNKNYGSDVMNLYNSAVAAKPENYVNK